MSLHLLGGCHMSCASVMQSFPPSSLDRKNGNTFWMDALAKEMTNLMIAFEIQEGGRKAPPGWFKASGHIIFDVKMDFTRKARWVKDGHKTPNLTTSSYAGVVSRESI